MAGSSSIEVSPGKQKGRRLGRRVGLILTEQLAIVVVAHNSVKTVAGVN